MSRAAVCHWSVHALLTLSLLAGCDSGSREVTQVVVTITSNLTPGSQLSRVEVQVANEAGDEVSSQTETGIVASSPGGGEAMLPLSFAVVRGSQPTFLLTVRGFTPGRTDALVVQKIKAAFAEGKSLLLPVRLDSICADVHCSEDEACLVDARGEVPAGQCGPLSIRRDLPVIEDLDDFDPLDAVLGGDADLARDAGHDASADARHDETTDAGVDAGEDATADAGHDSSEDAATPGDDASVDAAPDAPCELREACPANTSCSNGVCVPNNLNTSQCPIAFFHEGHDYFICSGHTADWTTAVDSCRALAGSHDLVILNSSTEEDAIRVQQASGTFWIAANDRTTEATWRWRSPAANGHNGQQLYSICYAALGCSVQDGSGTVPQGEDRYPNTYDNWEIGEPDNSGSQDCGTIDLSSARWSDSDCSTRMNYICESY